MLVKEEMTAVILAGGNSRRMGKDKGFLKIGGQTFVEQIIASVQPLVTACCIVANDARYDKLGLVRIPDLVLDSGPVAGIQAAMLFVQTPYLLVLSCDIPLIHTDLLAYLIENSEARDLNVLSVDGKQQPLTAIYNKKTLPIFTKALEDRALKLRLLFQQMDVHEVACPSAWISSTANINTPEDLEQLKHEHKN